MNFTPPLSHTHTYSPSSAIYLSGEQANRSRSLALSLAWVPASSKISGARVTPLDLTDVAALQRPIVTLAVRRRGPLLLATALQFILNVGSTCLASSHSHRDSLFYANAKWPHALNDGVLRYRETVLTSSLKSPQRSLSPFATFLL